MNGLTFVCRFTLPSFDRVWSKHGTMPLILLWGVWMLSYHQDATKRNIAWAILSQMVATAALCGLAVFGVTEHEWWNLILLPVLAWLQIAFTKRWWVRPGAWW